MPAQMEQEAIPSVLAKQKLPELQLGRKPALQAAKLMSQVNQEVQEYHLQDISQRPLKTGISTNS